MTAAGTLAAAALHWAPSPLAARGVVAVAAGLTGAYTIHWGDGSQSDGGDRPVPHTYLAAGAYMAVVYQSGTAAAQAPIHVRDSLTPTIEFKPGADNPSFVDATIGDDPADMISKYRFDWGDGTEAQELALAKGQTVSHGYSPGSYTATVTDLHTGRALQHPLVISEPEYDPDFTIARKPGGDTLTAQITISKLATVKEIIIDWGDYHQDKIATPAVGTTVDHTYAKGDTYIVQCAYTDGSTDGSARTVTVPFPTLADELRRLG